MEEVSAFVDYFDVKQLIVKCVHYFNKLKERKKCLLQAKVSLLMSQSTAS